VVSTTVLLLPEFLPDLVEDDAVVLSFNDRQIVVRTPRPRTLLNRGVNGESPGLHDLSISPTSFAALLLVVFRVMLHRPGVT
jgi:hypothetical protein